MPRLLRVVAAGVPHHVTQRGNARRDVFHSDSDRMVYLGLLRDHARKRSVIVLGYCLMSNHVHLVVVPPAPDAMALLLRDIHGRYAAYKNTADAATGHVWQGRYYSCPMGEDYLWTALRYVERNPVRAGIEGVAEDYPWSSAAIHCDGRISDGIVSLEEWTVRWRPGEWREFLRPGRHEIDETADAALFRAHTHSGRPLGSAEFVRAIERRTGRRLTPSRGGRPRKVRVEQEGLAMT